MSVPPSSISLIRLTFQQTDLHPEMQGLFGPFSLTACCRSARLLLCLRVSCHRALHIYRDRDWLVKTTEREDRVMCSEGGEL